MKITDNQTLAKTVKISDTRPVQSRSDSPSPARRGDRVSLSPQAQELRNAQKALDAIPDIRTEKVEEIKARIADGTYRIDSEQIAAKMIREALPDDE